MRRREFIAALGGVTAWPLAAARAQQPAMPVIGYLSGESPGPFANRLRAFHQGLSETGYVEGRNVAIEYRWAENQVNRLPALAADLVRRQVAVIATPGSTAAALAAKAATASIPIVFQVATDPVAAGLVAGLDRPGGNLTGVTALLVEVGPKLLEMMYELVPAATTMALLVNPTDNPYLESQLRDLLAAARTLGRPQLHVLHAGAERDFDRAFAELVRLRTGGLVIAANTLFSTHSEQLAALAIRHRVLAISPYREFAAAGGLMSYGGDVTDQNRLVGNYTGRILKGGRPDDLPVQQEARVELVINMKTAKAFGLKIPETLLVRADKVIE
jgi:putative ABC transport system substrate-binding protein